MLIKISITLLAGSLLFFWSCETSQTYTQGKVLYEYHCANCHMSDGTGLVNVYPPVRKSDYLNEHADQLPCIIRNGLNEKIEVNGMFYQLEMEGNQKLSNAEISNICNYMYKAWGNNLQTKQFKEINTALENCD